MAPRFGLIVAWFFGWGFALLVGLLQFKYARGLARFDEQTDAIGSTRDWSEVEAAEWKVWLTRAAAQVWTIGCLVALAVGVVMAAGVGGTTLWFLGWGVALLAGLLQYEFAEGIARFGGEGHWSEAEPGYGRVWFNRVIAAVWTGVCLIAVAVGVYSMVA